MDFEERTELRLSDHGDRIRELEISNACQNTRIDSLCARMEDLTTVIEKWMDFAANLYWKVMGGAGAIISALFLFLLWYIQSLPR